MLNGYDNDPMIQRPPIKAILFDVGGTLLHVRPSVGHVYAQVAARHGVMADADDLNRRFKDAWRSNRPLDSAIDKQWWREIVNEVFKSHTFTDPDKFFDDVFESFRDPSVWQIHPGLADVLDEFRRQHMVLAVASNWDDRLPELLDNLNLSRYFDHQFISFELGINKSNPDFYRECLKRLALSSENVIHIGDDRQNDLISPSSVGIRSFIIKPDLRRSFRELLRDVYAYLNGI